jgi:hypothetical protein
MMELEYYKVDEIDGNAEWDINKNYLTDESLFYWSGS